MSDRASHTLKSILEGDDYAHYQAVPVFDEHDEFDEDGQVVRRFDRPQLERIARKCNLRARESGDLAPIGLGHTRDDAPEEEQPDIVGYASHFRVGRFGPERKLGLLADFHIHRGELKRARKLPRRSIELWVKDGLIDWIALLKRTPQRDLGLMTYARGDAPSPLFYAAPGRGRPLCAALSGAGKLRYSLEANMPHDLDDDLDLDMGGGAPDEMPSDDPAGPPDAAAEDPEMYARIMRCVKGAYPHLDKMHEKYAAESAVDAAEPPAAPGEPDGDEPEMFGADDFGLPGDDEEPPMKNGKKGKAKDYAALPSGTNTGGPPANGAPLPPADDEKLRMSRLAEAQRISRKKDATVQEAMQVNRMLVGELARMSRESKAQKVNAIADRLDQAGVEYDRDYEVKRMLKMPLKDAEEHADRMLKYNRRSITHGGMIPTLDAPGVDQDTAEEMVQSPRELDACLSYMREHGTTWDEAVKKYRKAGRPSRG